MGSAPRGQSWGLGSATACWQGQGNTISPWEQAQGDRGLVGSDEAWGEPCGWGPGVNPVGGPDEAWGEPRGPRVSL